MGYLRERFGFNRIALGKEERAEIINQLKINDRKRINLFSFITSILGFCYLFLDIFIFNDSNQKGYLFFDSLMLFFSLLIVLNVIFFRNRESKLFNGFRHFSYSLYPLILLLWATGIVTFDPENFMNIIAFFIPFLIVVFAAFSSFRFLLLHYVFVLIEYSVLVLVFEKPFLSQAIALVLVTMAFSLPFYYLFRHTKFQHQWALNKLDKLNHSLEKEVNNRVRELQYLNINLKNEIGQRKIVEQKLRDALKRAESSDQLKSEFLANISHEIRTPLNAIIGFTEMITEEGVPHYKKKVFFDLIGSNTMYLLSTIDDIFDASLIKTQQLNPINKTIRVNSFLSGLFYEINSIKLKYQKNDIVLITKEPDNEELKIISDEFYLKKAMIRLIDNAFKFTQKGKIEIGARMNSKALEFFVSDTGIGIKEKEKDKIFQPFVQGDGSFSRGYGGSGLGLAIVNGIVTTLNCKMEFVSRENKGSTFSILFKEWFIEK
ncbi:MAG: HAMP domain-containing histidine kinase [Prolixibacteraceae bacterium]|nr:HAMP domain-containing histidine kinase [Prolixibacteraceae bacterium]